MADITNRDEIFRKDRLVQVYKTITEIKKGTTVKVNYRKFIYNKAIYNRGGLKCFVRDMTDSETISSGLAIDKDNIKVRFNHNDLISSDCKIIFKGKVYNVQGTPDNYNYNYRDDTVVSATQVNDTLKYESDIFMED